MKNKENLENIKDINETVSEEEVTSEEVETENETEMKLDVDALSEENAKTILKELIASNSEADKELEALKSQLNKAEEEAQANKDKWYRSVAEFENYKKRNADTRKNAYFDGKKDVILSVLVVGDSIERALSMEMDDKTREGVTLIARQFEDTLSSLGVTTLNPVGEPFDPNTCEAIHTVPCGEGEESGTIKTVFKKGYKSEDKIIRYCQVVVTQ